MGDSSDSEEFYDAEEFTPIKGSKRSSMCKSISLTDSVDGPDKGHAKEESPATSSTSVVGAEDDRTNVKHVVQGRRRFEELRRCMQHEEEDEGVMNDPQGSVDHHTFQIEHPFKIIAHDTMSLQSMTSLGRIGRILSGAAESHPNIRDSVPIPSASSREPSTISDDPSTSDNRSQNVLAMAEPDVIASTKANSLKQNRSSSAAIVAVSGSSGAPQPVAPPRKKKRNKLHGSQSLSTTDGDNLSICTADTDDTRPTICTGDKPHLQALILAAPGAGAGAGALPSPASTIESLTREFQDSLELDTSKYASDRSISVSEFRGDASAARRAHDSSLDFKLASNGSSVRGGEQVTSRGGNRTHSEGRAAPAPGHASLGASSR